MQFLCDFAPPVGEVLPIALLSTFWHCHCDVIDLFIDTKFATLVRYGKNMYPVPGTFWS
jgi:hypothetical protein